MCLSAIADWMALLCALPRPFRVIPLKESSCLGRCKPGDSDSFSARLNLMITNVMRLSV